MKIVLLCIYCLQWIMQYKNLISMSINHPSLCILIFGSIPSWCVYSGLCVHWIGSHLCSLRKLLHFSSFKNGAFCHLGNNLCYSAILYKRSWKNPIALLFKDALTELFWLEWNLYKIFHVLIHFKFIFFMLYYFFCKRHMDN